MRSGPRPPASRRDGLRSLILAEAEAGGSEELPAAPALDGVEFIEFAVDNAAGRELAGFLGRLGFRRAGRHRSKAAELYRHGRVNLVLNAEPDSAAAPPRTASTRPKSPCFSRPART